MEVSQILLKLYQQPCQSKMGLKSCKRLLITISVALVLTVAFVVAIFPRFPHFFGRPRVSLEGKVELFVVHYKNDVNATVYPSTSKGGKLLPACENVLRNLRGHLTLVIPDEGLTVIKNGSQYVEVILKDTYNFTIYAHLSATTTEVTASRILFILSGEEFKGLVLFDGVDIGEDILWGSNWKIDVNSRHLQKLVDVVNQL